jgi:hypothetical protein
MPRDSETTGIAVLSIVFMLLTLALIYIPA